MTQADAHLENFAARRRFDHLLSNDENGDANTVSAARITRYACCGEAIADLSVERAIRSEEASRALYFSMLARNATGFSPAAAAAASDGAPRRVVAGHTVELLEEDDGAYLVITLRNAASTLASIEARTPDGEGARVPLTKPIDGCVQLALYGGDPDLGSLDAALRRPDSVIALR